MRAIGGKRLPAVAALVPLGAVIGCSTQQKVVYEPVNRIPVAGDSAMDLRSDWPVSVARYQNGEVAAWSTRFPYDAKTTLTERQRVLLEPVMFVMQSAIFPVELVVNPPFQSQVWRGVQYRPSYTNQPQLPPRGAKSTLDTAYLSTPTGAGTGNIVPPGPALPPGAGAGGLPGGPGGVNPGTGGGH